MQFMYLTNFCIKRKINDHNIYIILGCSSVFYFLIKRNVLALLSEAKKKYLYV